MFDIFHQRGDEERYPDTFRATASYHAPSLNRDLTDSSVLDLGIYRNALLETRRDVHDVHEELQKLRKTVEALTSAFRSREDRSN